MEKVQLTQSQYDAIANGEITKSFEHLDLNNDGKISNADLELAGNSSAKSQITTLLNKAEEDTTLKEFSLDTINDLISDQATRAGADNNTRTGSSSNLNINLETVNVSDLRNKSVNEVQKEFLKVLRNINAINEEIQELLDEQIENDSTITALGTERTTKENSLEDANEKVTQEQASLDEYLAEYETVENEIKETNNRIRQAQNLEEANYQEHISDVIKRANENYNPNEHGSDFESYFNTQLSNAGYVVFSNLNNLNAEALSLSTEAKAIMNKISSQSQMVASAAHAAQTAKIALDTTNTNITNANNKITQNNTNLETARNMLESQKLNQTKITHELSIRTTDGGLTPAEVLGQIAQVEKDYAKQLGWDIKNCVIAKGHDGKFHIYNPTVCLLGANPSSVRAYHNQKSGTPYTPQSFTEIPNGSGFLDPNFKTEGNNKARAMYVFSSVNEDWSDGETDLFNSTYATYSPLTFDMDGKGISTSNQRISYDIDGDGTEDIINNSNEWVLAFDKDGNGIAGADGSELFGNNTDLDNDGKADGYTDGFEALKALAKKEGLISDKDSILDKKDIEKLTKKYGLKMMKGYNGEANSLANLGITQINLAQTSETSLNKNFDGRQNDLMTQEGATFIVNGETRQYADLWNKMYDTPKTLDAGKDIQAKQGNLNFSLQEIAAEEGEVDYDKIKNKQSVTYTGDAILEEIIEIEEKEEEL